jgi:dynamin GTPase
VIERLTDRRIAVEKAVSTLGEAPSGLKDVFELCRGFERAFSNIVNDSPSASKIKEAFFSERGLAGAIQRLPLESVFELDSVKRLCKTADGYQPHMVSPERGLRLMASKALDQVDPAVQRCVADVYGMLVQAGREAAAMAGEHTEAAMAGKVPLNVPEFRNVIMPAVIRALDEWRDEALRMARMMVDMERSYITAGFFRYTMYRRYERSQQQATLAAALAKRQGGPGGGMMGIGGGQQQLPPGAAGAGAPGAPAGAAAGGPGGPAAAGGGGGAAGQAGMSSDPGDYIAAFFDKKVNEDSARGTLPVDGWRWQRRFFIFSDSQRSLYYFKSPDDVPKPNGLRGQVFLGDCVVEDLDERGEPRRAIGSAAVEMQRGDRASLLLRLRSRDPRRPCVKDHTSVVLRAENVALKYEWIARLAAAAAGVPLPGAGGGSGRQGAQGNGAAASNGGAGDDADSDAAALDLVGPLTGGAATGDVVPQGASSGGGAPGAAAGRDRRDSFDGLTETRLGQGARFFRADDLRDERGFLLPAPCIVLGPSPGQLPGAGGSVAERGGAGGGVMDRLRAMKIGGGGGKSGSSGGPLTVQESWENRYEQIMDQFAQDMSVYMRMVCDTVVTTVPKSVVHCLVRKAEKNLLNHLFGFVHKMSEAELGGMLQEDADVVEKRKAVRALYEQVRAAIDDVQYMQERIKRKEDERERVALPAETLALAGLGELLDGQQRRAMAHLLAPAYLPALRAPVPMSHLDRPKKLPTAPAGLLEPAAGGGGSGVGGVAGGVAAAVGGGAAAAVSVARRLLPGGGGAAAPAGKVPPPPPPGTGGAANGGAVPSARRAPPPPPPK